MRSRLFSRVVVALALVGGSVLYCDRAHAQPGPIAPVSGGGTGPIGTGPIGTGPIGTGPLAGPAAPTQPRILTPETLADYLRKQNHKVHQTKASDGRPVLLVQIEQKGWKFDVEVEYTPTMHGFYLISRLGKVGPQTSSAQLLELLKANQKYGPSYFSIWADGRLCMEDYYGSQMNVAAFQSTLDRFLGRIQETHPLWDSSRWPTPAIAQMQP